MGLTPGSGRPSELGGLAVRDMHGGAAAASVAGLAGLLGGVASGEAGWWALAVAGAGLAAAGVWLAQRQQTRFDAQIAAQRFRTHRLDALLGAAWLWRADVQGRLSFVRPPSDEEQPDWACIPALGTVVLEAWATDDADTTRTLRARLSQGHAVPPVVVRQAQDAVDPHRRWTLRAQPCVDGLGRFCGFEGLLLPHAAHAAPTTAPEAPSAAEVSSDQDGFIYSVSHDLRAPLRVVEGFTRIVKEDYGRVLDRIAVDHLERVESAASRMNSMIDALLALARLSSQPLQRQPVNLSQLASFVIDDLRKQHPERVVDVRIAPQLIAQGDPTLLRLVMDNLLGNAWKYSAGKPQASIEFGLQQEGPQSPHYFVRDNGAGFDMRFADKLFGPFQRLHSASEFEGTGVGLASVRRIVQRHGGQVWAQAEVGQGACFSFTLAP